jgi:hypothetical protein
MGKSSDLNIEQVIESLNKLFNKRIVCIFYNGRETVDYGDNETNI